jgi:TonB family protein
MYPSAPTFPSNFWRWFLTISLLTFAQGFALLMLVRPHPAPVVESEPSSVFVWVTVTDAQEAVGNLPWVASPMLFAGEPDGAFSQAAARQLPRTGYPLAEWTPSRQWLNDAQSRLLPQIASIAPRPASRLRIPPAGFIGPVSKVTPMPRRRESAIRLDPRLAGRRLIHAPVAPVLPGAELQGPTVVEVSIDTRGIVVSTRLAGGSGNSTADLHAVQLARQLRFEPTPADADLPDWGQITFHWATLPDPPSPQPINGVR